MVDIPEKVPKIPRLLGWSLKKYEKSLQKLAFTPKWLFRWPYLQFWFLNFCLQRAIIIVCCFTHLVFPFSPVCVHPGKQSLSTGFKDTWKTINWYRNCPGEYQYQLLNCWYISIRQWICVFTEWLSIGNVHIVVSAINGLQSVVGFVVIFVLCHPASSGGFGGPPIYWRWNYNLVGGNYPKKFGKSPEKSLWIFSGHPVQWWNLVSEEDPKNT